MLKNKQNVYTVVRVHYSSYEEMGENIEPAVIETHFTFKAADDACTAYAQEYLDKGIECFKFCVKINTYYDN